MACWITDGSDGFTTNEDVVTLSYIKGSDGYFNAMWQDGDGVSSGEHYWKIHFPRLVYITAVGLTSKDHFKQGYDCRCLKYLGLGILSNGIRLLVDNFGPEFGEGDVIGILASFEGDRLKVYIDVNGRSLGLAFDVPASIFKSVYPMVSFTSSGSATCTKQTEIPDGIKTRAPAAPAGIQGNWELTYFEENGVELEPTCEATTKITKSDADEYSLNVEVPSIRMSTNLSMVDGNWKTSDVSTTLMDDESKKFENSLSSLIENVKIVEAGESGNLSVKSDTISSNWTRYDSSPELFTGDPFVGDPLLDEPYTRTVIKIRPGMFMPKNE